MVSIVEKQDIYHFVTNACCRTALRHKKISEHCKNLLKQWNQTLVMAQRVLKHY